MVGSDLITGLVKFGMSGDKAKFKKIVETLIADERVKQHNVLAEKLEDILKIDSNTRPYSNGNTIIDQRVGSLVQEIIPRMKLEDLILSEDIRSICLEVIEEHHRAELLRAYNLEPRNRILLIGTSGEMEKLPWRRLLRNPFLYHSLL